MSDEAWAGGNCAIAVDSNGIVHIVYPEAHSEGVELIYTSYNGSMWTNQTIETGNSGFRKPIDLAFDATGYPYLLYAGHPFGSPAIASWNGRSWDIRVIGTTYASEAVLALDSSGNPHVAYTTGVKLRYEYTSDWMGSALKYASWTGTGWDIQTLGSEMDRTFKGVSLTLDKNDNPYILYSVSSESASGIKLAKFDTDWIIQDVTLPEKTDIVGNVVVDSNSQVHFVYTQAYRNSTTKSSIMYASLAGTEWDTQVVTSEDSLSAIGKLVLDKLDKPHFTHSTYDHKTMYTTYSDSLWKVQTLPLETEYGGYLSIDQNGNPHLSYRAYSPARFITRVMYANGTETIPSALARNHLEYEALTIIVAVFVVVLAVIVGAFVWKRKENAKNRS